MKKVDVIIEYLGLDNEFSANCLRDFDSISCLYCQDYEQCKKEINIREKLLECEE